MMQFVSVLLVLALCGHCLTLPSPLRPGYNRPGYNRPGYNRPGYNRPGYIDCTDPSECSVHECCVIGMGRFSVPKCLPLLEQEESCSPGALPQNLNLTYPDGQLVDLTNVFRVHCPCARGLECSYKTGTCSDPFDYPDFNAL